MTKVEGNGFVYDLKDITKFPGTYKAFTAHGAPVVLGSDGAQPCYSTKG